MVEWNNLLEGNCQENLFLTVLHIKEKQLIMNHYQLFP